jgi:hypothetical protein
MFVYILAALAAAQAPETVEGVTDAQAVLPQAAEPAKTKPKHKRSCSSGDMALGSHIVMQDCPSDDDVAKKALKGARVFKQSIMNGAPPLGAPRG